MTTVERRKAFAKIRIHLRNMERDLAWCEDHDSTDRLPAIIHTSSEMMIVAMDARREDNA